MTDAGSSASPTFLSGYNFGGPATETVAVDGNSLIAQDASGTSSLRLIAVAGSLNPWATTIPPDQLVPTADQALATLLNQHLSVSGGGLILQQGVTNGTYQVFTYHMENNASFSRSFHLAVQGQVVTTSPISLAHHHWVRMGPYEAVVSDGVLEVELQRLSGDASIMGLELFTTTDGQVQDLPEPPLPGWTLVWSDEFDTPGLPDPTKWDYEEGYVRNAEAQYYSRSRLENARVEDGHLVIEARHDNWQGHSITSASLVTEGKATFRYGRIEVRAQVPTGRGTWPAIWMLGTNMAQVGWPTCGEIDIMEYVGHDPNTIYGAVHTQAYNHVNGQGKGGHLTVTAPWERFYVYAIEWFPDRIDFFVDDQKYFTFHNEGTNATWPFDQPAYLLINLAIGGAWGGEQGIDLSLFPHRYFVDYVRVYEWK